MGSPALKRQLHGDLRPVARPGRHGKAPTERLGALAHRRQPEPPCPQLRVGRIEAIPVVGDEEPGGPVVQPHLDEHTRGIGVLQRVRQRLLGDPEEGSLDGGRQLPALPQPLARVVAT